MVREKAELRGAGGELAERRKQYQLKIKRQFANSSSFALRQAREGSRRFTGHQAPELMSKTATFFAYSNSAAGFLLTINYCTVKDSMDNLCYSVMDSHSTGLFRSRQPTLSKNHYSVMDSHSTGLFRSRQPVLLKYQVDFYVETS